MRRVSSFVAALLVLATLLVPAALAAPGELDPTFAEGGSKRFLFSKEQISLRAAAAQPDGRIVLAGFDQTAKGVLVVRLLEDGEFDPSFGSGGIVTTPFPPGSVGEGRAVAIQPDGKIVVAGSVGGEKDSDFAVFRYEPNGDLDPSFGGGDGIATIAVAPGFETAEAVALGAGGRILLTGNADQPENKCCDLGVAVLTASGAPETSFDLDGAKTLSTTGGVNDRGAGIVEQPDGRIVIADATGAGAGNGFTLVRLLADGKFDPGFGTAGIVNTPIPTATNPGTRGRVTGVALLPDGRIVASGYGYDEVGPTNEPDEQFAAVRYLPDGSKDPSFGVGGIFTHQIVPGADDAARAVALGTDGRVVLAGGYSPSAQDNSVALMRLGSAGLLDPSFGAGGVALRGITSGLGNFFSAAAIDSRERVVVLSHVFVGGGYTEMEVSRFLGDIQPDPPPGPPAGPPAPAPKPPPHARIKAVPRKLLTTQLTGFSGTATAAPGSALVVEVQIALERKTGAKAGKAGTCRRLKNARGEFQTVKRVRGACPLRWLSAKGAAKWRFKLKTLLPPGRYVVFARARDAAGVAERSFSRAAGNRFGFRLLPAPPPRVRNP